MKGEHIHLLEKLELAGGSCDGSKRCDQGLLYARRPRDGQPLRDHVGHVPRRPVASRTPGVSVLDEYYWLNKHDPNYSLCRATVNRGEDAHTDREVHVWTRSRHWRSPSCSSPRKSAWRTRRSPTCCPIPSGSTNFWLYWQTMFAFQRWSSALEMKRYLCRYVHHIDGLPDFSALRFTKYNQYESMILPLVKYLEVARRAHRIRHGRARTSLSRSKAARRSPSRSSMSRTARSRRIDLIEDDLVFITNGCCTDTSCYGDQTHAPDLSGIRQRRRASRWDMWKTHRRAGRARRVRQPRRFLQRHRSDQLDERDRCDLGRGDHRSISCNICKRDPRAGKVTTGGIVTVKDSVDNWYLSWTINRQPQFKSQDKNTVLDLAVCAATPTARATM